MDEQLDNDLSNRIREVFDNFDEPYPSADEGWLLLRKNFPETEKKRPVAWLWWASAAAALLLFATIGLWELNKKPQPENLAVKPVKQQPAPTRPTTDTTTLLAAKQAPVIKSNPAKVATATGASHNNNSLKAPLNNLAAVPAVSNANTAQLNGTNNIAPSQRQPLNSSRIAAAKTNTADSVKPVTAKANTQQYAAVTPPPAVNQQVTGKAKPDSVKTAIAKTNVPQNVTAPAGSNTAVAGSSSTIMQQPVKVPKAPANSMAALFANEKAEPQKPKEYTDDKKVRFGVYAATFFNYAKGSNNQVNAGAGFTSDIKLSKNFKLSTGVALAQNTLSYNGGPPVASNTDALSRAPQALSPFDKESLYAANASFPVLKNYNASLIGLDIPMNIKYEFNPQKNDTYISAGLSSGTFINEAYTSVYGYSPSPSSLAAGASQQTTDETTRKNFSGFYFAKTLNVSFGVGYPVGKSNKLIIEPFLKYPLSGLGSQQIQFGAAGLNLKLNFSSFKK